MLIYHPAYDAHHAAFRILMLLGDLKVADVPRLQILDFFLAFPGEARNIRLPREHGKIRRLSESLRNDYHGPVNAKQTFRDMRHVQEAAMRALAAGGLLDSEKLRVGVALRTAKELPTEIAERISAAEDRGKEFLKTLITELAAIPTNGFNGLKDRTGLLEYRYDVA